MIQRLTTPSTLSSSSPNCDSIPSSSATPPLHDDGSITASTSSTMSMNNFQNYNNYNNNWNPNSGMNFSSSFSGGVGSSSSSLLESQQDPDRNKSYYNNLRENPDQLKHLPTLHHLDTPTLSSDGFGSFISEDDEDNEEEFLCQTDGESQHEQIIFINDMRQVSENGGSSCLPSTQQHNKYTTTTMETSTSEDLSSQQHDTFTLSKIPRKKNKYLTIDSVQDFYSSGFNPLDVRQIYAENWIVKYSSHIASTIPSHVGKKSSTCVQKKKKLNHSEEPEIPFHLIKQCLYCTELKLNGNKMRMIETSLLAPLTHLRELNISNNRITFGKLPNDVFSSLNRLTKLWMDGMGLKKLPTSLNSLTELKYLSMSNNKLTTFNLLNDEIGKPKTLWNHLTHLEYLNLAGNRLNRFPKQICNCKMLEILILSNNRIIAELPEEIENLSKLNTLFLNGNKISALEIHRNMERLESLAHLELGHNPNIHTIPPPIFHISKLESLSLNQVPFTYLSDEIGKLKNLTCLDLYGSKITTLPMAIAELTNLRELDLRYCRGIREFPKALFGQPVQSSTISHISPLTRLIRLSMSSTLIESVPEEISCLTGLQTLLLNDCPLLAEINGIEKLVNLVELDVSNCISLAEPPEDVCEKGLFAIREYLRAKNEKPSFFSALFGSVFSSQKKEKSPSSSPKVYATSAEATDGGEKMSPLLEIEHKEILVAPSTASINGGNLKSSQAAGTESDDDDVFDDDLEGNKKKESTSTLKSLFSFWK
ncbi:hypothetical protein C9374_007875 [Naegleria lovaniensis]|uniref:Disease resistance R13L4/SHOC-2-like LRR domain-containing protein n=1 Tax=Naegleria lovaniensis TaxID=51637 RepID=A0AA88GFX5_NAELO|nr:uncharacterized protein C9374_007875 [Naegleria lovaniensis]KAG2378727.1 hypothetical protein C9374_007875 [Naegleria lovaniensis]